MVVCGVRRAVGDCEPGQEGLILYNSELPGQHRTDFSEGSSSVWPSPARTYQPIFHQGYNEDKDLGLITDHSSSLENGHLDGPSDDELICCTNKRFGSQITESLCLVVAKSGWARLGQG